MIDRTDPLSMGKQAKLLGISRGTVYYLPRASSPADLGLMRQIDQFHLEHPFMGQRMLIRLVHHATILEMNAESYRRLGERLVQLNNSSNPLPASTGQDSCRRAVRIVDIDQVMHLDKLPTDCLQPLQKKADYYFHSN